MKHSITSPREYHETMVNVYDLMNKGTENLSPAELKQLEIMASAAEVYEDREMGLKPVKKPETIVAVIEQKMYENKMTQAALAAFLGLGPSKLSEIMNGKRKPDLHLLQALYKKLNIDPAFLLDHAV